MCSVCASSSFIFVATTRFSTGLVLSSFRLSSTSVSLTSMFTLPSSSGVSAVPFTVTLFTVPAPPKSSQLTGSSQLSVVEPVNCLVSHFPGSVS